MSTIANKTDWPENPKFIFTSLGYHADEIFKVYLANKIEKNLGIFYINMVQIILQERIR